VHRDRRAGAAGGGSGGLAMTGVPAFPRSVPVPSTIAIGRRRSRAAPPPQPWLLVHLAFTGFVASIPFEGLTIGVASLPRLFGWLFFALSLIQPDVCFRRPPPAVRFFGVFAAYFLLRAVLAGPVDRGTLIVRFALMMQLFVVLWAGSNLLRYRWLFLRTMKAFVVSAVLLAGFQFMGVTTAASAAGRESAFNEDPNNLGAVLSVGLVAAVGLGYGTRKASKADRWLAWIAFGAISLAVVRTASRGALVALAAGIGVLVLREGTAWVRFRNLLIVGVGLVTLVLLSTTSELARRRWELTLERGSLAGRERIYPEAFKMFLDRPLVGWGFGVNDVVLGARLGQFIPRDTHTTYLWVLTEDGLAGSIPYFIGLYLAAMSAWKARRLPVGMVPFALMATVLVVNLSLTWQYRKLYWLILAIALASSRPIEALKRPRRRRLAPARLPHEPSDRSSAAIGGEPAGVLP